MYGLSESDLSLQSRARAFADELIPHEVEAELNQGRLPHGVAEAQHARAIELGLYATNMPTEVGGQGCTTVQQVLVQEQAGRVTNALGWCMHTPPAWWPEVASDYQLDRWLLPTVRGEMQECYAITEEFAGSDVSALTTTARREGPDYVLHGEKWHVTSYNEASYAFVQALLVEGPHAGEQGLFVVDLPSPGAGGALTRLLTHDQPSPPHRFLRRCSGASNPSRRRRRLGDDVLLRVVPFRAIDGRGTLPGRCQRLIEEATTFARDRIVQGAPLLERQLVQAMLADSATELFAARSMVYETARSVDDDVDRKVLHARCSMVKLFASEMANRVADRAVQIFGGRGYMRENVAERFFRELRVERIWEGASEVQRLIIADQLAKRGLSAIV